MILLREGMRKHSTGYGNKKRERVNFSSAGGKAPEVLRFARYGPLLDLKPDNISRTLRCSKQGVKSGILS